MWIWILAGLVGMVVVAAMVLTIIGMRLPATHKAAVHIDVGVRRDKAWALIDDVQTMAEWMPGLTKVELLPERHGHRTFRQHQGRNSFVLEETSKEPGRRVKRTIVDDHGPFTGSWDIHLNDTATGTRISVTEEGTIKGPLPRALMKCCFGYDYYLKKYVEAVQERLEK